MYLGPPEIERRADRLRARWQSAVASDRSIPVDVERLARDFLGLEIRLQRLADTAIAALVPAEEVILLDPVANVNPRRARFSIAHEVGHAELHAGLGIEVLCRNGDDSRFEWQANRFGAALLMPADELAQRVATKFGQAGTFSALTMRGDFESGCAWLKQICGNQVARLGNSLPEFANVFDVSLEALEVRFETFGIRLRQ